MSTSNTTQGISFAVLGSGNIVFAVHFKLTFQGTSIARGIVYANVAESKNVTLTRKHVELMKEFEKEGFRVTSDNKAAVTDATIIFICVQPSRLDALLEDIKPALKDHHVLVSIVSGAGISDIRKRTGNEKIEVIRAMPNTAIAFSGLSRDSPGMKTVVAIFDSLGVTLVVDEEKMIPATALCACGIAFFCRAIRAASQGGIEIGFHSEEAIKLAAQTAKGAATLLLKTGGHPESEVDKVTTPQGCTISGLNQMEHAGFSSAFIKGIVTSAEKASQLYKKSSS